VDLHRGGAPPRTFHRRWHGAGGGEIATAERKQFHHSSRHHAEAATNNAVDRGRLLQQVPHAAVPGVYCDLQSPASICEYERHHTYILDVDIVVQQIAAIALFLATKVEEACRKIKELVIACCRVAQKNPQLLVDEQTKDFWRWRDTILLNEDVILEVLCFDLTFESPYRTLHNLIKYYNVQHNKQLRDSAWSFINDSNMTQLCLLYTSRTIACTALYCGAKHADVAFEDERGRPWWEVQRVTLQDIRKACNYMADFYTHVPGGVKAGIESIYVGLRSPIDGSASEHRTRLKRSQTPMTPEPMERDASEQSLKRGRDEDNEGEKENGREVGTNGHPPAPGYNPRIPIVAQLNVVDRPAKRAKTEERTEENQEVPALPLNGSIKSDLQQEEDAGSEEGEVEE
jgi:protein BUR2